MSDNTFNKDELEAPGWMNKSFFEGVLKKCENTDVIVVNDIKMSPATAKGDHYASVMFRATLGFDSKTTKGLTKSLIIKTMPQVEGHKMDLLKESFVFETEISMYSKTIPMFEAELRKIGDNTVLGAKVLFHSLTPHKCIIFEDIVPLGYQTLKLRMADFEDSKAALLKLSKWHAVSYKLAAEGDTSLTDYKRGIFSLKEFESSSIVKNGMKEFIAKCATVDELKQYVPKLQVIEKDLLNNCHKSFETYRQLNAEGIFVLSHGDFHSKNMMFKKNSRGETEDVILVDFQLCYFGPAILDVIYGLYMLTNEDVRQHHRDEFFNFYSSNFIETLKKLQFRGHIPKISDFFMDILRHRHWELFLMSTFLPLWYAFDCKGMDPEELLTSEDACKNLFKNDAYIEEVKRLLPMMFHRGYLE
ncbi:uncharacterized protein LOC129938887 [Eupeodes corollae]|uniref:uncharacterized protein LOC129938887 n=1 Tax=Eupeodes corollae TaxID=290404 RepID=UPI002492ABF6|nr:uncharacterized protein LOC129938887 [Eupeodes corollae]